ncbi:MAG TPA: antitoxin Xre/MbcA/ParS toxin-binding domain-containing protein, partial [Saprospiraceae bacterium]|nr:antitoxin Xre/MbcA/ParS toxin-binding domain-containing protein [Saprospiraceae bacterium]
YAKGEPKISLAMDDFNMPYLISNVRKGIGYPDFEKMVAFSSFTLPEWSTILHLTARSLQRYKQQKQTFDPLQSEKIIQIILLFKKGISVFGTKEKFDTWLDSNIIALGGIKPKEVLDSSFGIEWIKDELGRIEHGVLA